jgi:periplasmic iron binding protein
MNPPRRNSVASFDTEGTVIPCAVQREAVPCRRGILTDASTFDDCELPGRYRAAMLAALLFMASALQAAPANGREYYIGGPIHKHDMEIVANYLLGIEMAPMTGAMAHGSDVIHVEADVHATADNVYGYPDGAWVPYLTIHYTLEKVGSPWKASGVLKPMTAKDGPHYADNVKLDGPGNYKLTYRFEPPAVNGFLRHVDAETGVPDWWAPFEESFTFKYPQGN